MKLNNKGFAVSTFMYMILLLAIILILATLAILSSRRMILDRQKNKALENISQNQKPICEAVGGIKSIELGTEYRCEVKDGTFFNFYVLSTQGSKVNLIMDRNICEDGTDNYANDPDSSLCKCAWHAGENNNNYGPDTAMNALYEGTKSWKNIPNTYFYYTDDNNAGNASNGYTSIKISNGIATIIGKNGVGSVSIGTSVEPLKARLPKEEETSQAGCINLNGSCPTWLVKNLKYVDVTTYVGEDKYSMNNSPLVEQDIYGYWLLNSTSGKATSARFVYYLGRTDYYADYITYSTSYGVRPVITLPKSMLK